MKNSLIIASLAAIIMIAAPNMALAASGCPYSADNLEGYAGCIVQTPGGAVLGASARAAQMDGDHRVLLSSMQRNDGMPQQVMPTSQLPYVGLFGPYAYIYAAFGSNPYFWGAITMPYSPYMPYSYPLVR